MHRISTIKQSPRRWGSSSFWSHLPLLFFSLSVGVSTGGTTNSTPVVIDLSQPWEKGTLYNQNKAYCTIQSSMAPFLIEGWVVVEDGKLVAEGYGLGRDKMDLYPAFSVTKSFSTMLMGKMVELQQLTISETLGDVFNQTADWEGVTQATEKKTITIEELLTMTGGLLGGPTEFEDQETLQQVLNFMDYDVQQRGKFNYLAANHILSRIILRRSGVTPLQFARDNGILENMGIAEHEIEWETFGNVEGSAFGLSTTPRALAKLGQLYLQNGAAAPGNQLIPSEWVETSVTDQLPDDTASVQCLIPGYGYQWYADRTERDGILVPLKALEGAYMANGLNGQIIIVIPSMEIVIAIMSNDPTQIYSQSFLITILHNLPKLHEKVEEDEHHKKCDDFSLLSCAVQCSSSLVLGFCKILSNLVFE